MEAGLTGAELGGGIVKKRVAGGGHGKRGGMRLLIATNKSDRWFFVFGFAKNEQGNISATSLRGLKDYAADLLKLSSDQLDRYVEHEALCEICKAEEPDSGGGT